MILAGFESNMSQRCVLVRQRDYTCLCEPQTFAEHDSVQSQELLVRRPACMCRDGTTTAGPQGSQPVSSPPAYEAPVGSLPAASHAGSSTRAGGQQAPDGAPAGEAQQLGAPHCARINESLGTNRILP